MSERREDGSWASTWRLWELPELVAQITTALDPENPLAVSARRFDRERSEVRWPDAPTSAAIRARLGRPAWPDLLRTCVAPHRLGMRYRNLSRWLDPWQRDVFSEREVAEALQLIARRLGRDSLRHGEYSEARHWLLRDVARSRGARVPTLPTATQARYHAGPDWIDVLRVAGMKPASYADRGDAMRGLSTVDVLDLCLEVFGVLTSAHQAERFARANDLRFAYERPPISLEQRMTELTERRRARGLKTPTKQPRLNQRPDYGKRIDPELIPERYRVPALREHTRERCRAALDGFLDQLPSGLLPTIYLYREYMRRTPGAAPHTALQPHGGFVPLRDEAVSARVSKRRADS